MDSKKEVTVAEVMEELRKHEESCKEHRKATDQRFDGIDKRFDKTDDRIEKSNENTKFWAIMSMGVLSLVFMVVSTFMVLSNSHNTVVYTSPAVIEQPTTPAPN